MAKLQVNNRRQYMTVPPEVSSRRVTEKQLNTLAGKFGSEWENLAIHLDLTKADVDRYKADNPYNARSQIFSMLMGWRARKGSGATVGALVRNLEDFGVALDTFEFLIQKS
ncbi:PREDICTED: death domain-containing protein CRADD-like [Branchiostoma belcheri]|uniref:Death domain-containing protein CRADD-like n=1 Tax=Branchiostoma belcheri TaxID=7741 RepID=A0A6P4ZVD8_BRABE|nr:PREDICTED: death domain-containing protein CRADD-like [Branchiostoma belcheri]